MLAGMDVALMYFLFTLSGFLSQRLSMSNQAFIKL